LLVQNFISIGAPIVKRSLFAEAGGMDAGLWYTADWDLWLSIASFCQSCYFPEPTVAFRVHPASQTVQRSMAVDDFRGQLDAVLDRHIRGLHSSSSELESIKKCGIFSNMVNASLAAMIHGQKAQIAALLGAFLKLGPRGWLRYWQASRIHERILARLRARLR